MNLIIGLFKTVYNMVTRCNIDKILTWSYSTSEFLATVKS